MTTSSRVSILATGLALLAPVIASNDDGGGGDTGLDARIQRSLDRGCYWVEATSALPGHSGAYTLTVQAS